MFMNSVFDLWITKSIEITVSGGLEESDIWQAYLWHDDGSFNGQLKIAESLSDDVDYSLHSVYLLLQEDVQWM